MKREKVKTVFRYADNFRKEIFPMSRKMFVGATLPGCLVLALVCAMLILPGSSLAKPPDGKGNNGGGGGGGPMPVTVTFDDLTGDRLMSDGQGPYLDQVDFVDMGISTGGGNFSMWLTTKARPQIRALFLNFSECVSQGECFPPFTEGFTAGENMFTNGSGINLTEMTVGEFREDLSLRMVFTAEGDRWELVFAPSRCSDSTTIDLTKTGENPDTWVIEAEPFDVACLLKRVGRHSVMFHGLYLMPFMITVEAL